LLIEAPLLVVAIQAGCALPDRPTLPLRNRLSFPGQLRTFREEHRLSAASAGARSSPGFDDRVSLTREESPETEAIPRREAETSEESLGPRPGDITPADPSVQPARADVDSDNGDDQRQENADAADSPVEAKASASRGDQPGFEEGVRITQAPDEPRLLRVPRLRGTPEMEGEPGEDQEDTNLARPNAAKRGGGGGPTESEEKEDEDNEEEEFKSDLLIKALGLEDSRIGVFGWFQGSFTANPANPANHENFGVNPNYLANRWLLQQFYFVIERRLDPDKSDEYDYGYRLDNLFGTDWLQFHMVGFFDGAFKPNHIGYEPVQFFAEVHLPWFTEGGIDVKGGRFYALPGYEDGRAPGRPLNSTSYLFAYAHPFTQFGFMTTWHVTDRVNFYNGAVNGWDRWIDQNYRWGYSGALSWDSADDRTNFTLTLNLGPNQFPRFFKADYQLAPNGVPQPPFLAGRRNLSYNANNAILLTGVLIHEFTDQFTLVVEADDGYETNIPGLGPGGTVTNGEWYGLAGWMLYAFNDRWTGVYRGEVFRDNDGTRTGFDNTFYEMTLGLIWKPKTWLWFRPEIRYDWTTGSPAFNDEKSKSQLTFGFDSLFLF
jgi:hypothetical protein